MGERERRTGCQKWQVSQVLHSSSDTDLHPLPPGAWACLERSTLMLMPASLWKLVQENRKLPFEADIYRGCTIKECCRYICLFRKARKFCWHVVKTIWRNIMLTEVIAVVDGAIRLRFAVVNFIVTSNTAFWNFRDRVSSSEFLFFLRELHKYSQNAHWSSSEVSRKHTIYDAAYQKRIGNESWQNSFRQISTRIVSQGVPTMFGSLSGRPVFLHPTSISECATYPIIPEPRNCVSWKYFSVCFITH